MTFKRRLRKTFFRLVLLFLLMFIFRLIYGFISHPNNQVINQNDFSNQYVNNSGYSNIASAKYKIKRGNSSAPEVISVDQKYEKTANLACQTNDFDKDEKQIRSTIEEENAIIQFQQKSGQAGNQKLFMQIGVQPDRFDAFIEKIKSKQNLVDFNVSKKDKTNEYRELNSKIKTLQATRTSLIELKKISGKIEEYINLENRILSIDEELQQLGVKIGSFDTENEFCTVNISLKDGMKTTKISFIHRVKVALEWTIKYYLRLVIALAFALAAAFLLLLIIDKLKIINKIQDKFD